MRCSELEKALKQMDKRYVKAFVWAFALINLAFLFHSINFMFGDHDWNYVRGATYWNEGAFEGRPLHFVLQSLFFGGQILPFLNNFLAFAAMALSGILLAKYWKLPLSVADYALFAAFPAVLPYTLVWLYYAKDTLINLSLPLFFLPSPRMPRSSIYSASALSALLLRLMPAAQVSGWRCARRCSQCWMFALRWFCINAFWLFPT